MVVLPRPRESVYSYLSRLRRELGTDYVYVVQGNDVVALDDARVDVETARTLLDTVRQLVSALPQNLNGVVAEPADGQGKIHVYRIGDGSYAVAYVPERSPKESSVMRFEEIVV